MFKAIERYAKLVQSLSIIFGIFAGAVSLLAAQYDKRVSRSIEFGKLYNDSIRVDHLKLVNKWEDYTRPLANFFTTGEEIRRQRVLAFFKDSENRKSLDNLLDFFEVVWVCVDHRSCDRNTTFDLFGAPIDNTYEVYHDYIMATRIEV